MLAEGDEHKKQRKDLMPAFNFRHVKDLYPVFWDKSREMVEHLKAVSKSTAPSSEKLGQSVTDPEKAAAGAPTHAPGAIEVGEWSSRATLDIIGKAGMGRDFDALSNPNNELNRHYQNVFSLGRGSGKYWQIAGFFIPFWILKNIPNKRVSISIETYFDWSELTSLQNQEILEAQAYIKKTCRDLIKGKRQAMEEKKTTGIDIISVALESGGFSDEDLVNQMMTFLVAGHETTSTALMYATLFPQSP